MARKYEYQCDKCGVTVDVGKRCRPDGWVSIQVDQRGGFLRGRYEICDRCTVAVEQFLGKAGGGDD